MPAIDEVDQTTLRPINDRVIITPLKEEESSLIITPEIAKHKSQRGRVVAAGPGMLSLETMQVLPLSVKAGDIVLYGKYSGSEVPNFKLNGEDVLVMREAEILAILESE
jgi:chaperonin GroES